LNVYEGSFEKKNGEIRMIRFVKLNEVPAGLLPEHSGASETRKYSKGIELVWDLDKKGFRTFNWDAIVGLLSEKKEDIKQLR